MNIDAKIMTDTVHIVFHVGFLFDEVLGLALKQAELLHALGQKLYRKFLAGLNGIARFCELDALKLDVKHDVIDLTLSGCKFAVDRKRAGDIRSVKLVFRTGVDQDQVAVLERHVVLDVMQDRSVSTAADDRVVGDAAGSPVLHIRFHEGLDLRLIHSGLNFLHRQDVSFGGNIGSTLHERDLLVALVKPHVADDRRRVDDRVRRISGLETPDPLLGKVAEDLLVESTVDGESVIELVVPVEDLAEVGGKPVDRERAVGAEILDRALGALTAAEPRLHERVARPYVEREGVFASRGDDSDRVRLGVTRQVPEV